MELIFASQNNHKREELNRFLKPEVQLVSLKDLNYSQELKEDFNTIEVNALQKASFIFNKFKQPCISEDTALEVEALGGEPGVDTAHYAGKQQSADANMNLLLSNMQGLSNRKARFRTIICLILNGEEILFEGICYGHIALAPHGNQGFGYDPIFIPKEHTNTFAEMRKEQKIALSHRTKAAVKLRSYLIDAGVI